MPHLPTNELVGVHWIKSLANLGYAIPASSVNTTLPADNSTWEASGFIQVQMAGGAPDLYLPMNRPLLQVDCWAAKPNSEKPPWGKANNLAELIKAATYDKTTWGNLTLPATHENARVLGSIASTEPRRVLADEARFAVYTMDLELIWVRQ